MISLSNGRSVWKRWFPALSMALLMLGIFLADTLTKREIAAAIFYIVVILLAVRRFPRRNVIVLAGSCIGLTLLSAPLATAGSREVGGINLAISIAAISATTWLALRMVAAEAAVHETRAQLVRLARITSLGELTTSMAHELNQPLAGIVTSGNAGLRWLAQVPPNLDRARLSIERIVEDAKRASDVIERVRSLARSEAPRRRLLDINAVVRDAIALARGEIDNEGIALRLELAALLPRVHADAVQLRQVLGNLLLNAIEAMAAVPQPRRSLVIATAESAGNVTVSVADSGTGLTAAAREHLFETFWTSKEGGIGIGLAISRSIVEAHGGRIWATSGQLRGTTFHLSLPVSGDQ